MVDFANSYDVVVQEDDERRHDGASTASPESGSRFATSPSAFLSLSDHTFTPLSMDDSVDDTNSDMCWAGGRDDTMYDVKRAFGINSSPNKGLSHIEAAIRTATRPTRPSTAGRDAGNGIVSSLVQSIEHLHAGTTAGPQQYKPIATKNTETSIAARDHRNGEFPCLGSAQSLQVPSVSPLQQQRNNNNNKSWPEKRDGQAAENRDSSSPQPELAPHNNLDLHHHALQATAGVPCSSLADSPTTDSSGTTSESQPARNPDSPSCPAVASNSSVSDTTTTTTTTDASRVRTASICRVAICHPTPDLNPRSGSCLGNIAVLEATAERFSLTSSIEDAIREAHDELKRSDSRRSSFLRAHSVRGGNDDDEARSSVVSRQVSAISRQSSILGTNNAARLGGYSPAGYVSTPAHSLSRASSRYRSGSRRLSNANAMATQAPSSLVHDDEDMNMDISEEAGNGDNFPTFLSRHGSVSVRSVVSSRMSLAEIAETEPPMTLTQEAMDEADRAAGMGEESEDEDTIRASAHQQSKEVDYNNDDYMVTPQPEAKQQHLMHDDFFQFSAPSNVAAGLEIHQPDSRYELYQSYERSQPDREKPVTSGSGTTYDQVHNAFGDFDGVHCDPDTINFFQGQPQQEQEERQQQQGLEEQHDMTADPVLASPRPQVQGQRMSRALPAVISPRPKSYFDMDTGQQMLYYPARVPAMLNLPPKLSKSGNKAMARQKVRSQVLGVIAPESRESRIWLPDPLAGLGDSSTSLARDEEEMNLMPSNTSPARASFIADSPETSQGSFQASGPKSQQREIRRPQRLADVEARKSRMTVASELPSHLRASVFFDLPSDAPKIVVKDHSAMATLDSLLDASASAPVSAFTDHAFAGKLGSEVYGIEKEKTRKADRKSRADSAMYHHRSESSATNLAVMEPKKRALFLSLLGPRRKSSENLGADTRRHTLAVGGTTGGGGRASGLDSSSSIRDGPSPNVDQGLFAADSNPLAPDSDEEPGREEDEGDDDSDEDDNDKANSHVFRGPPTTLLAELQLRKQRNKLRTQPVQRVYPNGIHSTLLELDTVAQVERDTRKQKKVNLAWEDPAMNHDLREEEDDEEVPLAMLAAAKAAAAAQGVSRSSLDISAVMDEVNRPLGLMERREMEENEPLSRRRDRLQGRGPRETMNLETMHKRMTTLHLVHGGAAGLRSQSRLALPLQSPSGGPGGYRGGNSMGGDAEPEVEGETLAERRKRMQGETLPQARPVSSAFSLELLSQFGGDETRCKGKAAAADGGPVSGGMLEEAETLGQRRRRLQAEREARQQEMGPGWTGSTPQLRDSQRTSMADVLAKYPLDSRQGYRDPRQADRGQIYGIPDVVRPPPQRMSTMPAAHAASYPLANSVYGAAPLPGGQSAYNIVPSPAAYGAVYNSYEYSSFPPPQQLDKVERWRQSIMPS